jgi:hypothetical protein
MDSTISLNKLISRLPRDLFFIIVSEFNDFRSVLNLCCSCRHFAQFIDSDSDSDSDWLWASLARHGRALLMGEAAEQHWVEDCEHFNDRDCGSMSEEQKDFLDRDRRMRVERTSAEVERFAERKREKEASHETPEQRLVRERVETEATQRDIRDAMEWADFLSGFYHQRYGEKSSVKAMTQWADSMLQLIATPGSLLSLVNEECYSLIPPFLEYVFVCLPFVFVCFVCFVPSLLLCLFLTSAFSFLGV